MSDSPYAAAVKRIEQRAARMRHKIGDPFHICQANHVDGKLARGSCYAQQPAARGEARWQWLRCNQAVQYRRLRLKLTDMLC